MPAAAHAATSGSPWRDVRADRGEHHPGATPASVGAATPASATSAVSSGSVGQRRVDRRASRLAHRLELAAVAAGQRPAAAGRARAAARYSAVSPPVKPVAPNRTMSYGRSWASAECATHPRPSPVWCEDRPDTAVGAVPEQGVTGRTLVQVEPVRRQVLGRSSSRAIRSSSIGIHR